jgi:hypothetical protein
VKTRRKLVEEGREAEEEETWEEYMRMQEEKVKGEEAERRGNEEQVGKLGEK